GVWLCDLWTEAYIAAPYFFQAEDGIRDRHVTGVQTCALPISIQFSFHASVVCNCGASLGRHPESLHYSTGRRFRTGEVESVDNLRGSELTTSSLLWRLWRRPSAAS